MRRRRWVSINISTNDRLWHIMLHMKTASIRDVRNDFNRVLAWVDNGEEVAITKHRRTVARLVPAHAPKAARARMPDLAGRLQKVFGDKVVSDQVLGAVLEESRGIY
jgi:prevent-host-death family protein